MNIQFQYAYEDFDKSLRKRPSALYRKRVSRTKFALVSCSLGVAAVSLIAVLASSIYLAITVASGWLCALILPLFLIAVVVKVQLATPKNDIGPPATWRSHPLSHGPVQVELTPTQMRFLTPTWRDFVAWSAVESVYENAHVISVSLADASYLIPKRAFANGAEAREFSQAIATCARGS